MTSIQLMCVASLAGAMLFFVAGAVAVTLRQRRAQRSPVLGTHAPAAVVAVERVRLQQHADAAIAEASRLQAIEHARLGELERLRRELAASEATVRDQQAALDDHTTIVNRDPSGGEPAVRELEALRVRAEAAGREVKALRERAVRAEAAAREAGVRADTADASVAALRSTEPQLRGEVARLERELAAAEATATQLRAAAEARARQLASELDRSRTDALAGTRELEGVQVRLGELERELAERTQSARDLSTEHEQLKGRLRDAEGLRADYVRLRTAALESEFLKSEVARLEEELRMTKVDALGAPRPRPVRGTARQPGTSRATIESPSRTTIESPSRTTIGESLATVIERFADAGTRSSAVADPQGFPLASSGHDGLALAAYAALFIEAATRAKEFLPVDVPAAIEIVDQHGARVSVWTFDVDGERLLLANLAVTAVDDKRVEATLSELATILAPSAAVAGSYR